MHVSLEGAAALIRSYEPHFVPGLMQTEEYARGVLKSGAMARPIPTTSSAMSRCACSARTC